MAVDARGSSSSLFRRVEQLKRWQESETNKQEVISDLSKKSKVKFSDGCVFLAASSAGDTDELKKLLARGADINTVNQDGITALHAACIDNNLEMVEFLVDNGADINRCDMEGWTPLHATASCGYLTMAKFLIDRGADPSVVNNDGELAIDVVDQDDVAKLIQEEMQLRGIDSDASRSCEERQMLDDAQLWYTHGRVEEEPHLKTGATALHVAAAKGYIKVLRLLIQTGADVNAKDLDGWTPLHAAAHWGQNEAVEILCDSMADMNVLNYVGQTPYDLADDLMKPLMDELKRKQDSVKLINKNKISKRRRSSPQREKSKKKDREIPRSNADESEGTSTSGGEDQGTSSPEVDKRTFNNQVDTSEVQSWRRPSLRNKALAEEKENKEEITKSNSISNNKENKSSSPKDERNCQDILKNADVSAQSTSPTRPMSRSFVPPSRDDESETQRKAHAKMVRSTRRSTQGITLEDVKSAEQLMKNKSSDQSPPVVNSLVNSDGSSPTVDNFSLEDAKPRDKDGNIHPSTPPDSLAKKKDLDEKKEDRVSSTREGTSAAIQRRRKPKRRSTGVVQVDMDEVDPERKSSKDSSFQDGADDGDTTGAEEEHITSVNEKENEKKISNRSLSRSSSVVSQNGQIDYKKLYEEQVVENDRLMNRLRSYEKELRQSREAIDNNNKMNSARTAVAESERRERRSLERKLSEMEEELKELEQLRQENQRLRDENGALIRVISKLSR